MSLMTLTQPRTPSTSSPTTTQAGSPAAHASTPRLQTANPARFGRFVVAPFARGTGIGPEIVRKALAFTTRWPGDVVIEAQSGLVGYYNRFGFNEEGEEFLDGTIPHIAMRLERP
ncbi:GNAT family N-acetyltransferase [Corynebacterium sp. HMSC30G07]|uniref:GNAT family N-acetyltransferase n=1 Tax=Corynebacterium sp. HMSC30G07 TaxID=1581072 RepID=UPI000AF71C4D|nr:GNAT family N-acetyltransferase [Corynebacterium sp. HMSC30G07]